MKSVLTERDSLLTKMAPREWQRVPVALHLEYFSFAYLFIYFVILSFSTGILNSWLCNISNLVTVALLLTLLFGLFETTVGDHFSHGPIVFY